MIVTDDDRFVLTALATAVEAEVGKDTIVTDNLVRQASLWGAHPTGEIVLQPITGEAGPESSTGAPVGTIFVGFAGPDGPPEALRFAMPGDRTRIRGFATQAALDLLRRRLLKLD